MSNLYPFDPNTFAATDESSKAALREITEAPHEFTGSLRIRNGSGAAMNISEILGVGYQPQAATLTYLGGLGMGAVCRVYTGGLSLMPDPPRQVIKRAYATMVGRSQESVRRRLEPRMEPMMYELCMASILTMCVADTHQNGHRLIAAHAILWRDPGGLADAFLYRKSMADAIVDTFNNELELPDGAPELQAAGLHDSIATTLPTPTEMRRLLDAYEERQGAMLN